MNKLRLIAALILMLTVVGCGKKNATEPAKQAPKGLPPMGAMSPPKPAAVEPAPPGSPVASVAPAPVANPGQFNGRVALVDAQGVALTGERIMNRALEIYCENMGQPKPKDINELIQAQVLQSIPAAPAGMKWALDPKLVKIVTVKQ